MMREQTIAVWQNQVRIRVLSQGSGPALVFFHGSWGLTWDPFLDELAKNFTVYAPEHPGTTGVARWRTFEQGNVRALTAAVGVKLVEDKESQARAVGNPDRFGHADSSASTTSNTVPLSTWSPTATRTSRTTPGPVARIGCSIFIASSTTSGIPSPTRASLGLGIATTTPANGAVTDSSAGKGIAGSSLTDGASVRANTALIVNDARVAGEIARRVAAVDFAN